MRETLESISQYLNPLSGHFFAGHPVHFSQTPNLELYTEHLKPSVKGWRLAEQDRLQSYAQLMGVGRVQMVDVQMGQIVVTDLLPPHSCFIHHEFSDMYWNSPTFKG